MRKPLENALSEGIIEALVQRQTTSRAVAAIYEVSEAHLCRTLKLMGVVRVPAPTTTKKAASKRLKATRTECRMALARRVVEEGKPIHEAAAEANCCVRTMYRYVELLR
jgi:hypothetical protein